MSPTRTGTRRWRSLRLEVFHEAGWTCERCGRAWRSGSATMYSSGEEWRLPVGIGRTSRRSVVIAISRKTKRKENTSPENLAWRSYLAELAELTRL